MCKGEWSMLPETLIADAISAFVDPVSASAGQRTTHDHAVSLYDDEADLIRDVALHVLQVGLISGQRILIVATSAHRAALDLALSARGADPAELRRAGSYLALDAAETLARFMVDGRPDAARFAATVRDAFDSLSGDTRLPRVYGEMVALLWHEGNVTAAIELERLWNDLAGELEFALLCGYPMTALERHADLEAVRDLCHVHTGLLPPRRYGTKAGHVASSPEIAERSEVFLSVPEAVAGVRHWLKAALLHWDEHGLVDDAIVVASELATNAIRHAHSPFRVTVTRVSDDSVSFVRLVFEDLCTDQPALNSRDTDDLGGRGVHLVAQLASRWGVDASPVGKRVWAEFQTSV